jgi:uncharacterized damage-inducible protein DinB
MSHTLTDDLKRHAVERLTQYLAQIEQCAALLTTDELWSRPNAHVNSVANLVLHLTGNVRQWIVHGIGGAPFDRDRPAEFAARDGRPASEIVPPLRATVEQAIAVIQGLDADALATPRTIQGYPITTQIAVLHVVEHFAFHTGQIIHATKWLRNVDLSLYDAQGQRIDGATTP